MHDDMGAVLIKVCAPISRCCIKSAGKEAANQLKIAAQEAIEKAKDPKTREALIARMREEARAQGLVDVGTELPTAAEMATPHNITWSSDTRITAVDLARGTMGQTKSLGTMGQTKSLYSEGHVTG
jgi:hypothetical protein